MDSEYRKELEVAIGVVKQAARISQEVLPDQDKGAIEKDDNLGPVTVGDFAIQALLTASLHHAFPEDGFVGEEAASALRENAALCERVWGLVQSAGDQDEDGFCTIPASKEDMCDMIDRCQTAPGPGRVWVFDPIDGTKTFLRREQYAINVALLVDGKQTVAVVGCPLLSPDADIERKDTDRPIDNSSVDPTGRGCLLFAVRSHGTFVQPLLEGGGSNRPAKVVPRKLELHAAAKGAAELRALRPVTSFFLQSSALDEVHRAVAAKLGVPFPGGDLVGWVPRWASLAMGLANMTVWVYYKRGRHAKIWDHAGAMLLFEEVGGTITDVDGKPLDLLAGRIMTANFGFVAAAADVHGTVLGAVHDVLREQGRLDLLGEN
ncbi:myo-inositol-monophosphatase [Grosmannia clavigera kw1407]|uniref:Myo-inositol-monophosphatase n=1 Tax=Grosmannia clavigera (strain kw1407 / UAMH 11150) TaxID=655863 RepID=F0XJ06_GROCL|nr:myo-inositol-monophosphatase [Grosmannia clavigera kw1407]EFX02152.1 myo-inositol-monophosphatase [Grosmannia clavigera kw1407]